MHNVSYRCTLSNLADFNYSVQSFASFIQRIHIIAVRRIRLCCRILNHHKATIKSPLCDTACRCFGVRGMTCNTTASAPCPAVPFTHTQSGSVTTSVARLLAQQLPFDSIFVPFIDNSDVDFPLRTGYVKGAINCNK